MSKNVISLNNKGWLCCALSSLPKDPPKFAARTSWWMTLVGWKLEKLQKQSCHITAGTLRHSWWTQLPWWGPACPFLLCVWHNTASGAPRGTKNLLNMKEKSFNIAALFLTLIGVSSFPSFWKRTQWTAWLKPARAAWGHMNECTQLLCLQQILLQKKGNHYGLHLVIHHSKFSVCFVPTWGHGLQEKLMQEEGKERSRALHSRKTESKREKGKVCVRRIHLCGIIAVASNR